MKIENQELIKDKDKLQAEMKSVKSELQVQNAKFSKLQSQFNQVQSSLIEANDAISRLSARVQELCRKLKEAGGNDERC